MSRSLPALSLLLCALGGFLPMGGASASSEGAACTASAPTLDGARRAYAASCTLARVDCDPVGGRWMCSSERIGARAPGYAVPAAARPVPAEAAPVEPAPVVPAPVEPSPVEPVEPVAAPVPPTVPPVSGGTPVAGREGGACAASGPDLGAARASYAARCSAPRVDCDAENGTWTCASYRIGLAAPGQATAGPSVPAAAPATAAPVPAVPVAASVPAPAANGLRIEAESGQGQGWESRVGSLVWRGPNRFGPGARRDDGNIAYRVTVPAAGRYQFDMRARAAVIDDPSEPPNDVWVSVGGSGFVKAFISKGRFGREYVTGATGEVFNPTRLGARFLQFTLPAGPTTLVVSGRSNGFELDWIELRPLDVAPVSAPAPAPRSTSDLIAIHFDSSFDPDDLQAMVAMRHVLDRFPERDVLVVNGTRTYRHDGVLPGSLAQARSLFPDTIDATDDPRAEDKVATAWQLTLAAGHKVMVAEAGPSGFTARVLDKLRARGVRNLKNVVVVQHSHGWNEDNTRADYLRTVQSLATYVRIDNGNFENGTPDFLEFNGEVANRFRARALNTRYADAWRRSFSYFEGAQGQGRSVDFSDAVELFHILGIPKSAAPTATGFADRYF